ncbi:tellurite resistance TerB family protein [Candidatus Thiothrix sp. Deng01]|uniref:Tellurite resistance TerB family protein n=1 Tax=Candidatus Thiothrix phosphatis TaxID=3112415 RepID=A0ABU6D2G9_9GAMM|nr:tellurite resistance TerB family protein [Candidatus Thiothrix sp. Deng01]MEB4593247.1 tellurite resistance TerB family protein [Candidatus Thiothrix sp. Deng01]
MSFFDTLKQKAGEARAKLATEVGKFRNREFMEACVAGCALVAAADGNIDSSEKQKMMKFIQQSDELKVFETKDVIAFFNKIVENFEFDNEIGKAEALKVIGKLRSKPDAARLMVRVCVAIGSADGSFDDKEKQVVREICRDLGVPMEDFGL